MKEKSWINKNLLQHNIIHHDDHKHFTTKISTMQQKVETSTKSNKKKGELKIN
jgi:hypothetical protein